MRIRKYIKVIFVDFFALFVGIINGFFIPKVFSIDGYSFYKLYGLYITYAGIFHLGFSDGIYILLGGKSQEEIDKKKVRGYFNLLFKIDIIVTLLLLVVWLIFDREYAFLFFALYVFPFQIVHFFRLLYRSMGEFDKYSILQSSINVFSLLSTVLVITIIKSPTIFIIFQILTYAIIALVLVYKMLKYYRIGEKISFKEFKSITEMGFIIMVANTIAALFFSLDRWFIKFLFSTAEFAYYSFAVSMLNLFLALVSSLTILFYPYFSRNHNNEGIIRKIKYYLIMISSFAPCGYFVLELIVNHYLPNYKNSLIVLSILILTIPFITIVNILYSNLYKVRGKGKQYIITVSLMLAAAFILCIIFYFAYKNSYMIAYATLTSFIIWYFYSSRHFGGLNITWKEILFFIYYFVTFQIIFGMHTYSLFKCLLYGVIILIGDWVFFKEHVKELFNFIKGNRSSR